MNEIVKVTSGKDLLKSYAKQKKARQIFGRYIYEGELSVLFGDSNAGKSILANDIAFFVSGGGHEWEGMESPLIPSLYIDMEMTGAQFARRYANAADYMTKFYYRAEVEMNSVEDKWNFIRNKIVTMQGEKTPPKFVILDNITNGFGSIFSAKRMRCFVSELKTLKDRFGLTILLIAHCPKRDKKKPITDNSLGGTKMIINFVDSAFAVGSSEQGESIRYIKQIKARECEKAKDVMSVYITNTPYLSFKQIDWTSEEVHIDPKSQKVYEILTPEQEIKLLTLLSEIHSNSVIAETSQLLEIAEKTGLQPTTVFAYDDKCFPLNIEDYESAD
jgi:archaellum biogenesis ATPase FlaH